MQIILNKVLTGIVVWQISLYTLYKFTYLHNRLRRKALHLIRCYLCVELVSSRYSFTHSHAYAIFQSSPQCTNQYHVWRKNTMCNLFCSSLHTHSNDVVSLLRANAENVSLPGDLFEIQMHLVSLEIRHLHSHFASGIP